MGTPEIFPAPSFIEYPSNQTAPAGAASLAFDHILGEIAVFKWALIFAVISIIAGIFGFTGISADTAGIAKVLFYIGLVIFLIFICLGVFVGKKLSD
jgi:uncharacterized membrane protein YtjA (UPF0391 family)